MHQYSPTQFGIFRIVFGFYLFCHFLYLVPFAEELFGAKNLFCLTNPSPYHGIWPNPLFLGVNYLATILITLATLLSVCIIIGWLRKTAALTIWYISTCLFTANPLIANPSLGYTGLLLLLLVIIPRGESFTLAQSEKENWKLPKMVLITAWTLLALGYTFSGIMKLESPSWTDGTALSHVLENPLARPNALCGWLLSLPSPFLALLTWGTLLLETIYLPLTAIKQTRPWVWVAMVFMHLGIMLVIDFADLSLGMLMIHLFTFNPQWLSPIKDRIIINSQSVSKPPNPIKS